MAEPCPWQMLLPPSCREKQRLFLWQRGLLRSRVPAVSVPMHFRSMIRPSPARWDRAGGAAVGWDRAGAGQSPVLAGASAARWERDTFCMRLGVFGVVVSVGDAIALFCLGARSRGRLDVLLF